MEESKVKSELEQCIISLERLLQTREKDEAKYQQFFEENPIVFRILGYRQFLSFTKQSGRSLPRDEYSGLKPEPDFLAEKENNLFEIFEIKTPVAKQLIVDSNKYRERFTSEIISYISQTITYEKYFTRNPENRKRVNELFNIQIHENLDIKIVIGLNDYIDRLKIHQMCRDFAYKIDIITYDDILNMLKKEHSRVFGIYENLPGFSFHFVIQINRQLEPRRSYLFDIGDNPNQNRISFYVEENGDLCFRVIDNLCKTHLVTADENQYAEQWIYLVCEFGKTTDGFIMTLGINGQERDRRVKDTAINLRIPLDVMTLGCDLSKRYFARFNDAEEMLFDHTFEFKVKHDLMNYFLEKYKGLQIIPSWAEFDGTKYMYRDDKGLIQDKTEFAPVYRKKK